MKFKKGAAVIRGRGGMDLYALLCLELGKAQKGSSGRLVRNG